MKRGRGNHKGSAWEREVARILSLWWTKGERDDCLYRTSQSGGRATTREKKGQKADIHCGDLCATDEEMLPFTRFITIEVKRGYSKNSIQDLLDKPVWKKKKSAPQEYEKWILKAERDRIRAGSVYWIIICRRDKREPLIIMLYNLAVCLDLASLTTGVAYPYVALSVDVSGVGTRDLILFPLSRFLQVEPKVIRDLSSDTMEAKHARA